MAARPIRLPAAEGYALWAQSWDATPSPVVALEERLLSPWLEALSFRRAIDIGCGTGRWTTRLRAIGLDLSISMLHSASRKPGLSGRLAAADAAALPVATASADFVLCTLTLGHVPQPVSAFREFARVLRPGGLLVLSDFHPAAAAGGWRRTFRRGGQVYEIENHPYTLAQLADSAPGLRLVDSLEAPFGAPERPIFEQAGKPELFEAAGDIPAVLLSRWRRE